MSFQAFAWRDIESSYVGSIDCKTVRIFAYSSTQYTVKQKVWNEAENRELHWGETPRFTDFFTDFEKKPDCFAV